MSTAQQQFTGVLAALVTPMTNDGEVDEPSLGRLLDHVLAGGAVGVSPTGSTGEGWRLTLQQRLDILDQVLEHTRGTDALIAPGLAVQSLGEGLTALEEIGKRDVTAVLVAPPAGYPMSQNELYRYYESLAEADLVPILLYNIPAMTGRTLSSEIVGELARHRNIIGIKDSSRDLEYLQRIVRTVRDEDIAVLTGTDSLLQASLAVGVDGAIVASVNLVPELSTALHRAVLDGAHDVAADLQERVADLVDVCRTLPFPTGWKSAVAQRGIIATADLVPPGIPPTDEDLQSFNKKLWATRGKANQTG